MSPTESTKEQTAKGALAAVEKALKADVFLYNADLERPYDQKIIDACIGRRRRKNMLLILITEGGSADVAYRIARCFQEKYERFYLYVAGYCKSAGTIVALGANEIIFSDHGELGPLDVQMRKKDELFERQSGNTVMGALAALRDKTYLSFEEAFLNMQGESSGGITAKTAAKIATNLTKGLFSSMYAQIDPLHVGEAFRALSIARAYGKRLQEGSENWKEESLDRLISGYPEHGFVIDRREAENLFENVREPSPDEIALAKCLGNIARRPASRSDAGNEETRTGFLSEEPKEK